jgi:geranylgeranyl pyrophosphate synthase
MTGKPHAADLYQSKVTLPVIYALRHAEGRDELARIYRRGEMGDTEVQHALEVLEAAGSRAYTDQIAAQYHHEAMRCLDRVHTRGIATAESALSHIRTIAEHLSGRSA